MHGDKQKLKLLFMLLIWQSKLWHVVLLSVLYVVIRFYPRISGRI